MTKIQRLDSQKKLTISVEDLLMNLRLMGFGLGCWFYSNEELELPDTKKKIENSIVHLLELNEADAEQLAELLIQNSLSFSTKTVDKVNQTARPHSLGQFIESATGHNLQCCTK